MRSGAVYVPMSGPPPSSSRAGPGVDPSSAHPLPSQVGQVAVSGGIMAVELNGLIQASPGNGTDNSIWAIQPRYEVFNFQVWKGASEPRMRCPRGGGEGGERRRNKVTKFQVWEGGFGSWGRGWELSHRGGEERGGGASRGGTTSSKFRYG